KCTRISIEEAVEFFDKELNVKFPINFEREDKCNYSKRNRECYYMCKYRDVKRAERSEQYGS
ncbi:MAG: radical SAM protein, partial [Thermoanaerobacterium sp.]|nr:radical SAM protein [Thermoanaerobacterium sp.]